MDLRNEVIIEAAARVTWEALGERFAHIGEWAAPIDSSCLLEGDRPGIGATRACHISRFGPMKAATIKERLVAFDREAMSFEYEALEGMPGFVKHAINRWSVEPLGQSRCVVRAHATLTMQGPIVLASCLIRWQLQAGGVRVAEELKYFVEKGKPHPRKEARQGR